jgi:uncharacterized membrane protein
MVCGAIIDRPRQIGRQREVCHLQPLILVISQPADYLTRAAFAIGAHCRHLTRRCLALPAAVFSTTAYMNPGTPYMLKPIVAFAPGNIRCSLRLIVASASGVKAMSTFTKTVGAASVGGLLVYFLDPDTGKRRRALVKDQSVKLLKEADCVIEKASRDLSNRARGAVAEARSLVPLGGVSDEVLVEQVRSRIDRVISFPHFVEVSARDGDITVRGAVLESELDNLLSAVSSIRQVASVHKELRTYREPRDIPGLQHGEIRRRNPATGWTPAARLAMGVAGGALAIYGGGRSAIGKTARLAGFGLLARALTNMPVSELLGISPGRGIHIQKAITMRAPVQKVFHFLSNYQNLPQFLSHLREIRRLGNNTSHWVAVGPAGTPIEWDAQITHYEPNKLLAWKSLPGSTIRTAGILRLEPLPGPATRVSFDLSYVPPAGALGHAVASLFGANPKQALDDDLNRLKTLLETGRTKGNGAPAISGFSQGNQQAWEQAT